MKNPQSICDKQQKVVKKEGVSLRCLNRKCDVHGQEVSDNICQVCPFKVKKHVRPCRPRPQAATPEAVMRWNSAGRPTRTDEEVGRILETICKPCSWYDPEKKRCRGCGCTVSTSSIAVANKLKMATEKCPRGLWG